MTTAQNPEHSPIRAANGCSMQMLGLVRYVA